MSKTDNSNIKIKLDLRRYFLRKVSGIKVLNCCEGENILWKVLMQEFDVKSYMGLDLKAKKGRLRFDSARFLAIPGWHQNVIDIDTYGSPWRHWIALLGNVEQETIVFLTIGQRVSGTIGTLPTLCFEAIGLRRLRKILPGGFNVKLAEHATQTILTRPNVETIRREEIVEARSDNRNVRYIGVRLKRIEGSEVCQIRRS